MESASYVHTYVFYVPLHPFYSEQEEVTGCYFCPWCVALKKDSSEPIDYSSKCVA
jgi:hypothetical protein